MINLNPKQKEAIEYSDSPLLILAGAGSGKTMALTHKVAYLIQEKGMAPESIVALTFTNKAAKEMADRLASLLDHQKSALPMVGTFHSFCLTILRAHIDKLGYSKNFIIYDKASQLSVIKQIQSTMGTPANTFNAHQLLSDVSKSKQHTHSQDNLDPVVAEICLKYQQTLKQNQAVDFDDILVLTLEIFNTFPEVLDAYQTDYQYILVDEYQDTNHIQYELVYALAKQHQNICVVGDFDQAIYSWRGANIQNILDFENDFPNAKVIKLEQNYRSTKPILDASNALIENNTKRKPKKLWTDKTDGELLEYYIAYDEREEADYVAKQINAYQEKNQYAYNDFAILYRTHAQSRAIEEALNAHSVPYRLVGGTMFYNRQEIKDIIAYLHLVENPHDNVAFSRVIQRPLRGIGATSIQKLLAASETSSQSIADMVKEGACPVSKSQAIKLSSFFEAIYSVKAAYESATESPLSTAIEAIIEKSGYKAMLEETGTEESVARLENLMELKSITQDDTQTLPQFLHSVSLLSDLDQTQESGSKVSLMTLHHAKGLEFPAVYIVGFEEGLLPYYKSTNTPDELEEERRLAYVGITRGQKRVTLCASNQRTLFGTLWYHDITRFASELPKDTYRCIISERVDQNRGIILTKIQENGISYTIDRVSKPVVQATEVSFDFQQGDRVAHKVWGEGTIVNLEGEGEKMVYHISFRGETKKLMAKYSPLTKL